MDRRHTTSKDDFVMPELEKERRSFFLKPSRSLPLKEMDIEASDDEADDAHVGRRSQSRLNSVCPRRSAYKKIELPTYSGGEGYMEFKYEWAALVEPDFLGDSLWEVSLPKTLKSSLNNDALSVVKHLIIGQPDCYARMWEELDANFGRTSNTIPKALAKFKNVCDMQDAPKGVVLKQFRIVYAVKSELEEAQALQTISMTDIKEFVAKLPKFLAWDYCKLNLEEQTPEGELRPLVQLCKWLHQISQQLDTILPKNANSSKKSSPSANKASNANVNATSTNATSAQKTKPKKASDDSNEASTSKQSSEAVASCAIHKGQRHETSKCSAFLAKTPQDRLEVIKKIKEKICYHCLNQFDSNLVIHYKSCPSKGHTRCTRCPVRRKSGPHHQLLCFKTAGSVNTLTSSPAGKSEGDGSSEASLRTSDTSA